MNHAQKGLKMKQSPSMASCPSCGTDSLDIFYELEGVPIHSVLLLPTRREALNYPTGDIMLGFCQQCGMITNVAFDPTLHTYSEAYEATQSFSPTFSTFHRRLASQLIKRYDLHHKQILEIGCGQGEFLSLLCELGENRGIGFDPVVDEQRTPTSSELTFIKAFYSEQYAHYKSDFICCKMTLEHIQQTGDFVRMVRRAIDHCSNTIVFFQVPDASRILRSCAFEDIYYEHCSYFTPTSLKTLFQQSGFKVLNTWPDYDGQYLMITAEMITAEISEHKTPTALHQQGEIAQLAAYVDSFSDRMNEKIEKWQHVIDPYSQNGQRIVIWGSGSKAVSFLSLNITDEIEYIVDINPYRQGTYMAGTGHEIVGPEFLLEYQPDLVIIMNRVYAEEIGEMLNQMELSPKLMAL